MNKAFILHFVVGVAGLFVLLTASNAFAAELNFKVVPNTTTIEVRIDPLSKVLNVVDGAIAIQGAISDKISVVVETGGSVLTLWPTPPYYNSKEKIIRFVGGVPSGFNREGLLFKMRLTSSVSGDINISWSDGTAYLNDGKGTQEVIIAKPISININKQDLSLSEGSSSDTISPSFDIIEIGRDVNVYDGKYFISIHATDDISGVARYEVKEGKTVTTVIDGVYIFRDQTRNTPVIITAYDQVGNSKTINIPSRFDWTKNAILLLLFVIILFVVFKYVYKKFIKK